MTNLNDKISEYTQAIGLNPHNATPYAQRGAAYVIKGDYETAIDDLNKALSMQPTATAFRSRGAARLLNGQPSHATVDFSKALRLEPDHPDTLYQRGVSYQRRGKPAQAVADFKAALDIAPEHPQADAMRHAITEFENT